MQADALPPPDAIADEAAPRDACETWPREQIAAYQLDRLRTQLDYVGEHSVYYRRLFAEHGFRPADLRALDDLRALPFTRKRDYVDTIARVPPYGEFRAVAPADVRRIHFSSGTSGAPAPQYWTDADLDRWAGLYARYAHAQGVRPGDVYQCLFGFAWFVGGLGATAGYQKLGATCIPGGSADSERQIRSIFEYGVSVITATPSFVAHLAQTARSMGLDARQSPVRHIMLGGETGASVPATRERLEAEWNAKCFDAYGSLEFQTIGQDCHAQSGPHLAEDFAYAEIVDEHGDPVADGTPGVLVLTHLDKQAGPLVRWWTGDVVVRDSRDCACGRTHARLAGGVQGRADDMLVIRGVNVFPSSVEQIVRGFDGLSSEYQIVLDPSVRDADTGFLTGFRLRVEPKGAAVGPDIAERLAHEIRAKLQVRATIEIVAAGSLPRSTHKSRRVVREGLDQ
ncbi:AMP-binding protein [Paraburkholderia phymatum]|uniref:phenylacetate--CoA ligase family protein n=1 Tax=Paraburkholderia phymatum TaxID=148447 RepID=UPI00317BA93C